MIVTQFTRNVLAARREAREMKRQGYERADVDWRLHSGDRWRWKIVDVRLSNDRKSIWFKAVPPEVVSA